MNPLHRIQGRPAAISPLRSRCAEIGLPTWLCDSAGALTAVPVEEGPAGAWLRSEGLARHVGRAAAAWTRGGDARPARLFTGAWLMPVRENGRRGRTGFLMALSLEPSAMQDPEFAILCRAACVDPSGVRLALEPMLRAQGESVDRTWATLGWMAEDLRTLAENSETVAGFSEQLTESYETISLLYSIGRSMTNLRRPDAFVGLVCERLQQATNFGWIAAVFRDCRRAGDLARTIVAVPDDTVTEETLREHAENALRRPGGASDRATVAHVQGVNGAPCSQIVLQPLTVEGELVGLLMAGDKRGRDLEVSSYDVHLLETIGASVSSLVENAGLYAQQRSLFMGTLGALTASIDAKDRYTRGHSERVAHLASRLALAIGLSQEEAERVRIAGLVHDVGKIGVPEGVLCKAGRLTDEEFGLIKRHPEIGFHILRDIDLLADVLPAVLHHHERWDGRGYPHGLKGEQIPLYGRLVGLADTFDAMSSTRSYRPAVPRVKVLEEIANCAGTQFDPALAAAFRLIDLSEFDDMLGRHAVDLQAVAEAA